MAVKLTANYAKRLGLPGYSSHQFSVSVETELTDLGNVQGEASRLYSLLQDAIDSEIQHVGFVPGHTYGMEDGANGNANGHQNGGTNGHQNGGANGGAKRAANGNAANGNAANGNAANGSGRWSCSDKQKELILKLVTENGLDRNFVEETALERFGSGVKMLNKLQASGLIAELIELADRAGGRGAKAASGGSSRKGGAR